MSKIDTECYVILNCGPLFACLVLKLSVQPAGARRIRENQKPPNSRNKNRQIEEPRL